MSQRSGELRGRAAACALACALLSPALSAQGDPAASAAGGGAPSLAASGAGALFSGTGGVNAVEFIEGTGTCGNNALQPIGWQFHVVHPVIVSALCWFDDGLDGLSVAHEVGIWDPSGALIEATHVTIPAGTAAALDGHWRVVSIPPIELPVGTNYIVGGLNGQFAECLYFNATQTVHPDLVFVDATYLGGTAFLRPESHSVADNGFYGVGFQIGGVAPGAYCFGDGSGAMCPCANSGGQGEGCANSSSRGALLVPDGSAQVSADDLSLRASQVTPNQAALLFAGVNQLNGGLGLMFGDGLRCVSGGIVRLGVNVANSGGVVTWGPGLVLQGGWNAGETRRFQVWYRDPVNSPCSSAFNLSHGVELTFTP